MESNPANCAHLLDELVQLGGLGESLDVGDGQTHQQVHQDDGHQDSEEEEEEVSGEGERLALHILN